MVVGFLLPAIIADDERITIPLGKLVVLVKHAPRRRTAAHVEDARKAIQVIGRIGADLLPTLVAANGPMIQAHRPIPRQSDVPFHVAVETEQLAQIIHAQVRWIASAGGKALPLRSVRRNAKHRCLALEEHRRTLLSNVLPVFDPRAVTGHEIQPAIVPTKNRVRVVVPTGVEWLSNPPFVNEFLARPITLEHLDSVAADRVKFVVVNQQSLRAAPAQPAGNDFERVE